MDRIVNSVELTVVAILMASPIMAHVNGGPFFLNVS